MKKLRHSIFCFSFTVALTFLLAACASPITNPVPSSAPTLLPTTQTSSGKPTFEIFSMWGGAGNAEIEALIALENVYREENPNLDFVHNATGGGGGGTDEFLLDRLRQQEPPDTFVVHAGKETLDYVNRGQVEPITKLFYDEGLDKVMPPLLLEQITIKGEIYSVPVNIHRSNLLWYNPKVFRENHLQPPRTMQEFFEVAEKLQAKGITPLAVGGGFELAQLFESVLLATYGPEDYVRLVQGDAALWDDPRLQTAIETFKKMLDVSNADRAGQNWVSTARRVLEGTAGMTVMGDWVNGLYTSDGAQADVDYGWLPAPGTDGMFLWLSDSFALPRGAPHRDAALGWLKVVGSKKGQDAFNPIKGAIPARIDADKSLYGEYAQWSIEQFRTNKLAPSIAHGAAAPDAFRSAFSRATIDFSRDLDKQTLLEALRAAVVQLEE